MMEERPIFEYNDNIDLLTITGISILEDASEIWLPFFRMFKIWAEKRKKFTVDFKLKGFSSSSSLYLTMMTKTCEEMAANKKVLLNWYYCEADEDSEFKGEIYKDMTKRAKFNLVPVQGYKL